MKVISVKYLKDYLLEITFSDKAVKQVDLKKFITEAKNPMTSEFKNIKLFKKISIEYGHLSWDGKMDLSAQSLYCWED